MYVAEIVERVGVIAVIAVVQVAYATAGVLDNKMGVLGNLSLIIMPSDHKQAKE